MSRRERSRLEVMSRVRDGAISVAKAAELLKLSVRQARRVWKRYRSCGDAGLVHGLRGKRSNRSIDASVKRAVLALYTRKYADFGPTLASEKLAEHDGQSVKPVTLWRWLLAEGLWARQRRRQRHRSRRERRGHRGELVQMDGSHHDWFEGRGPRCVLMVMVDDATGTVLARFYEGETTAACFDVFGRYVRRHGIPHALYVDRDSIYRSDRQATVEEQLRARGPLTQFSRAMKDLGVELILAHSPQAKGRVERANGTLQDRLVKEMRLAGVSDIASANAFLEKTFLSALNRKFAVKPREDADLHRRVRSGVRLDEVLCFQEARTISSDWCVSWRKRVFQLDRRHESLALAKRSITVREKLDGTVQLLHRGRKLKFKELKELKEQSSRAVKPRAVARRRPLRNNRRWVPPPSHPWVSRRAVAAAVPRVSLAPAAPTRDSHAGKKIKVTVLLK